MSSTWSESVLRSTSLRLSIVYVALLVAAFLLVGVLIWFGARDTAETQLRQAIRLEVSAIETELATEGLNAAIAAIRARAERPGALEYWLATTDGRPLVGDLPAMNGPDGWRRVRLPEDTAGAESRDEMLVLTETLADGVRLSVGDELRRARAVQDAVLKTLVSIGSVAVALCIVVGVVVTRRILASMGTLSATLARVTAGDLGARFPAPAAGTTSDVEQIGAAVNTMLDRIEELIADVRRVSRDVAHDLRTPLTHLQQHLEEAKRELPPARRREAIEAAERKLGEILKIFDAILRLSELEAGAGPHRLQTVDVTALAETIADAYRPDIEASGRALTLEAGKDCWIRGDADLLHRALANLLENAMGHTPAGTQIRLRTAAVDGGVQLEVVDDGPGIPRPARQSILQPFARLDRSRSRPGSGLGLSLVAAIARYHGAQLALSDAEPGLRVSLTFRRERRALPADRASAA